jgi:hypothetical protein
MTVSATYINTADQLAYILTKALGQVKFQELRLGLEWSKLVETEIRGRLMEIIPCPDPEGKLVMQS